MLNLKPRTAERLKANKHFSLLLKKKIIYQIRKVAKIFFVKLETCLKSFQYDKFVYSEEET
jgi:hypothetical protein